MEKSILEIQLEKMQRYIAKGWTKKELYRFFPKSSVDANYSKFITNETA